MKLCNKLPQDVLSHIYEYDSTYKTAFREPTFAEELLLKSWEIKIDHIFRTKKIKFDLIITNDNDDYDPVKTYIIQFLQSFISRHLFILKKDKHKRNILNYIKIVYWHHLEMKRLNYEYQHNERFELNNQLFNCPFYDKDFEFKYFSYNTTHTNCYFYYTNLCYYYNNILHNDLIKITFTKDNAAASAHNYIVKYRAWINNLTKNTGCGYSERSILFDE